MRRFPLFQLGLVTVLVILGGSVFTEVFELMDVLPWVVGAALLPVCISIGFRAWRLPHLAAVALADAMIFIVFMSISVFRDSAVAMVIPSAETLGLIVDGVRSGWSTILSSTVPAPARPTALFVPVALTWLAAFISAELVFRTRRVFPVLMPAIGLALSGILFSQSASGSRPLATLLFVADAAALLAVRTTAFAGDPLPFDRRAEQLALDPNGPENEVSWALWRQRLLIGIPFVIAVVIIAPLIAQNLPFVDTSKQVLLRNYYDVPLDQHRDLNPLTKIGSDRQSDTVRYRVTLNDDYEQSGHFATDVLGRFDGVQWSNGNEYVSVGAQLPAPRDLGADHRSVEQQFEAFGPVSGALPAMARAVRVEVPPEKSVQADPETGTVRLADTSAKGFRYTADSEVGTLNVEDLLTARAGASDTAISSVSRFDQLPPELAKLRDDITGRSASQFQQLGQLLLFFHDPSKVTGGKQFSVDPQAPGGFSVAQIAQFVSDDGPRTGRPEMFAAAFATLARSFGFPARVVVGYSLPGPLRAHTPYEIHDRDLTAWPEVAFDKLGWVGFNPSPTDEASAKVDPIEKQIETLADANKPDPVSPSSVPPIPPTTAPPGTGVLAEETSQLPSTLLVTLLVLVLLLALLLSPWIRKRRLRRRRRTDPDPAARIAGAWADTMDRLTEAGVTDPRTLTSVQAAEVASERFGEAGGQPVAAMGPLLNRALHAKDDPAPELAEEAWLLADQFTGAVRGSQSRIGRVRASVDRRPLVSADKSDGGLGGASDR